MLNLFIDLHTQKEIAEIIRRVMISSMLIEGKTYNYISETIGANRTTISNINRKIKRQKSVIADAINKVGGYSEYINREFDDRDTLSRWIDNTISKRDIFGMFSSRRKRKY